MSTRPGTDDKTWYNRFYGERARGGLVIAPEIIERYRRLSQPKLFHLERWHQLIGDVTNKKVLYVGCGTETSGILLALRGAQVWAFDLAFEAVRHQWKMGIANGTADRSRFVVGSCGRLPFRSQSFDLVIGIGILHHLQDDLDTPSLEVIRTLKKGGYAVFEEPIIRSKLLARVRKCIPIRPPKDASPTCRPLPGNALETFARHFELERHSYRLLARLDRVILREAADADTPGAPLEFASRWLRWLVIAFHYIDFLLLRIPGFDRFAGAVVLKLTRRPAFQTS